MHNIALILSAFIMIFSFCGSTMETLETVPQTEAVTELAAVEVSPVPAETASPGDKDSVFIPLPETSPEPSPASDTASIFYLLEQSPTPETAYQVDMAAYYLDEMISAAENGNVEAGRTAEENRNAAIDAISADTERISFDDLYLLARVIYSEAGSDWLDEEFRICVGEVVLNRVASPEFPDTIYNVVYQKGQYPVVSSPGFAGMKPGEDCVSAALKLLQGERRMVPSVVYQSDCIQGELFSMYSDRRLGNTYFCLSPNQELYPID